MNYFLYLCKINVESDLNEFSDYKKVFPSAV